MQPDLVFEAPLSSAVYQGKGIVGLKFGTPTVGSYSVLEEGMTLELWTDGIRAAHGRQRVRGDATSTLINVGRSAIGVQDGELNPTSGDIIRVYNERRIWAKIPYIDPNTGIQLKDQRTWAGDNPAKPPVANAGPPIFVFGNGNDIEVELVGDDATFPSFATSFGDTIADYQWDLRDGSTLDSISDPSLTATFPPGYRYVRLWVTDTNGISHSCYKLVVNASESECIPVSIARETLRRDGVQWQFTVDADLLPQSIREGAPVLYMHKNDDVSGTTLKFAGWLSTQAYVLEKAKNNKRRITIDCIDAAQALKSKFGFPQTVKRKDSGLTGWYLMPNADIDRFTHYYWQWHSNLLDLCDFYWSNYGVGYPLPEFTSDGANLWEQGERIAKAIGWALTSNSRGQVRVVGDPNILGTADQAALYLLPAQRTEVEVLTLDEEDYSSYSFDAAIPPRYYWYKGMAITASQNPDAIQSLRAIAPSSTPGQGAQMAQEVDMLVVKQSELNVRIGNIYTARINPKFGTLNLELTKTKWVIEPADMEWVRVILPADARVRYGLSAFGERYLPIEVVNRYDNRSGTKRVSLSLEKESVEEILAETQVDPPNQGSKYPDFSQEEVVFEQETNVGQYIVPGTGNILCVLSNGRVAVTNDFQNAGAIPTWTTYDHSATLGTQVQQWCLRAGQSGVGVAGWILTTDKIIYAEDLETASPSFTTQHTFSSAISRRNIDSDYIFAPGEFACVISYPSGKSTITYTVDGGSTWTEYDLSSAIGNAGSGVPGIKVSTKTAGRVIVGDRPTTAEYELAISDEWGVSGSFSADSSNGTTTNNGALTGLVSAFDNDNIIYYGYQDSGVQMYMMRSAPGVAPTDITPVFGVEYGPNYNSGRFTISVAENNPNMLVMAGINDSGANRIVVGSIDGGNTWIAIDPTPTNFTRCALVNNGSELYLFGESGAIAYSSNPMEPAALEDKTIPATSARIVGIAGF